MRVIHVLNDIRKVGNGIVDSTIDLACAQASLGHDVAVASAGGEFEELLARRGIRHYSFDQRRPHLRMLPLAREFASIATDFRPDVVHAQMRTAVVLVRMARTIRPYGIVASLHTHKVWLELLMALADRAIAVSEDVRRAMASAGFPRKKLVVVQNGPLGSAREDTAETQAAVLQRPAITTIAGLYYRKGISELIAAFETIAARFPAAHLYIVGHGPDRAAFEAQARATPVASRIHFEGFQAAPKRWLRSTDIFVLASRLEPSGLVLADAREAGCAIVASNVGGIPEVLDCGNAGLLVPPGNVRALADAIASLLGDQERRSALAAAASRGIERFSVDRVARETLAVYSSVLARRVHP